MKEKRRLILLDTHAILHRAYHALPDFSSSKGEPTGALYGLVTMLVRIIKDLKPDYIIAAWDLPKPTVRHLAYDKYKATRPKAADDLVAQIQRSRDVISAFAFSSYEAEGFEADDIIGTVVEKLKKEKNLEIIIASGDMDTLQLVDGKRVRVYTLKKGLSETVMYDEAGVKERYGFGPELIPDYKGLRGDPSDNIPGVKGIGEKTAGALIAGLGDLDAIYTALKKHPEKLAKVGVKEGMLEKLRAEEEEARFSKMLAEIRRDAPINFHLPEKPWRESTHPHALMALIAELEFRSLLPRVKELFGAQPLFEAEEAEASGENIPEAELAEVALAVWVLDSNITNPGLDDIYRIGTSRTFAEAKAHLTKELAKNELTFVYEDIELPLMPILRRMEKRGLLVNRSFLSTLSAEYHKELDAIGRRVYRLAGKEFNINSPRQLGEVLFDDLGLTAKHQKKTSTGARSTRESELEKMRESHPIVAEVLAHRELQKLLSTYIDTIPGLLDENNRLHTTFVQTGTTTGRLASIEPNLQNIPIKSDLGRRIRDAFVATPGFTLLSFDYSQIEMRLAAILSGDPALKEVFERGQDPHAAVAARIFGIDENKVTYEQRRRAKVINFGILYGMGVNALRESLGTTRAEAQEFYNHYFNTFSRLAEYIEETKADAARRGYTTTLFGRRRYVEGIRSSIPYVRAAAERMAVNAPMQGTQADIVKLAMIRIDRLFEDEGASEDAYTLLQVHDELLFEIRDERLRALAPRVQDLMEHVLSEKESKGVPILAKGQAGKHWGAMREL